MQKSSISPLDFVIQLLALGAGFMVFASLLCAGFNLHPGIFAMGAGNILSLPARRYERRRGIRHVNLFQLPSPEEYIAGNSFTATHAASFCSFENALLLAGFIDLLIGLIILF